MSTGAGDDFAGTWMIPASPAYDYTFRTDGHGCSAPFGVTTGQLLDVERVFVHDAR